MADNNKARRNNEKNYTYFLSSVLCVLFLPYKRLFFLHLIKMHFYNILHNIVSKPLSTKYELYLICTLQ